MSEIKSKNMQDSNNSSVKFASSTKKVKRPISFAETFSTKIMPKVYGFGAAVAIMGAMFKLLSLPGGAFMLGAGLSTEAFIFFISAFEKPAKEFDWSIVFPQLDKDFAFEHGITNEKGCINYNNLPAPFLSQKNMSCGCENNAANGDSLSSLLEKCNVDQESLNKLGNGIKNLSHLCSELGSFAKTTVDWNSFAENFNKVNISMGRVSELSENMNSAFEKINGCFGKFEGQDGFIQKMESKTAECCEGLSALSTKITELSKSYDNVLRALRG